MVAELKNGSKISATMPDKYNSLFGSVSSVCSGRGDNTTICFPIALTVLRIPSCNVFIWKEKDARLDNNTSGPASALIEDISRQLRAKFDILSRRVLFLFPFFLLEFIYSTTSVCSCLKLGSYFCVQIHRD